jgi:hypothetical protein
MVTAAAIARILINHKITPAFLKPQIYGLIRESVKERSILPIVNREN